MLHSELVSTYSIRIWIPFRINWDAHWLKIFPFLYLNMCDCLYPKHNQGEVKNILFRPSISFIQIRDSNSSLNGLLCDFIHYHFYAAFVFVLCRVHFNHVFVEWYARILQFISNLELSRYSIIWRYFVC